MVQPNAPRFLREGDKMEFSTKIVNLTDKELTGTAQLELFDASTNTSIDGWFRNSFPNQYFTVGAGQSESVKFPIDVPYLFNKALVWRIVARSGNYSDGEENSMPVLTNRMLVTESLPINMKGSGTKNFSFEKLLKSAGSESLQHQSLTVEYSSNPAWYAVLALPYSLTRGGSHTIRGNSIVDSEYGVLLGGYDSGHSLVAGNSFAHIGTFAIQADPRADWSRIDDNRIDDVGVAAIAF